MAVFAVITSNASDKLGSIIPAKLEPQDFHKVDERTWFVKAPGTIVTPKELSDFLGISQGGVGHALIFHITTYWGYHAKETWDWLSVKGV
ncbi:hypothetical protein [Aeromonas eucrenophila]|uniref:Uncharacterized protein n=1 Tax=Aeromonas eucrenophila TaxID=649 RepID=A0ABW0YF28_9GAMM|nr:hypothetical protein [Aeromonas eucrenophila]